MRVFVRRSTSGPLRIFPSDPGKFAFWDGHELGYFLEGKRDGCPVLDSKPPGAHPRAEYSLNFQDPAGPPSADPLVVDGHEWQKIGWEAYDIKKGYGWSGPYIGDASIMLYQYLPDAPVDDLRRVQIPVCTESFRSYAAFLGTASWVRAGTG